VEPLIDIEKYTFSIEGRPILDSVTLSIYEGEYFSIIGPNGAGKTTLLRCLMRIYTGGRGKITLFGKPLDRYGQRDLAKLVSYVPQSDGRPLPFTVEEYLMMGRYPYLSPFTSFSAEDRRAVRNALELTGTAGLAGRHLGTLSGGERRTVAIAAALAQGARVMLLDEPTTFLDPKHESDVLALISRINREEGITVVSVTHDINGALLNSDRIGILENGAVVFLGPPGKVMSGGILEKVYEKRFCYVKHPENGETIVVPEAHRR